MGYFFPLLLCEWLGTTSVSAIPSMRQSLFLSSVNIMSSCHGVLLVMNKATNSTKRKKKHFFQKALFLSICFPPAMCMCGPFLTTLRSGSTMRLTLCLWSHSPSVLGVSFFFNSVRKINTYLLLLKGILRVLRKNKNTNNSTQR